MKYEHRLDIANAFCGGEDIKHRSHKVYYTDDISVWEYKGEKCAILNFKTRELKIKPMSVQSKDILVITNNILNRLGKDIIETRNGNAYFMWTYNSINISEWTVVKL